MALLATAWQAIRKVSAILVAFFADCKAEYQPKRLA